ncbi:STAS domain-containing protein [Williamsia sp. 1135]|uniref:STAS domain-containing protein n=1 Tax=Williamsia sp. 1135 TaxID=1889262 RepID=UPI00143C0E4A|nr:STAS domain-containing protein [Williamsia sp. 1135]
MTLDSLRTRTDLGPAVAFHPAKWSFAISVEPVTETHALVRVRGDVDMVTAPRLLAGINEAIADHTDITVDLSDVNFFSCAAAEIVLAAYARRPDSFRILAPSRAARRVLDLFADDRLIYDIGVDAAAVH